MAACPDIAELDINPLFAGPAGAPTAAADARVTLLSTQSLDQQKHT
jgi:hypothetical protein